MIHERIFVPVQASLKAKGLPFEFIYGQPQVEPKVGPTRLYFELDADAGDRALPARSQRKNGKRVGVRAVGARVVILARSSKEGAQRQDHEELALQVASMVQVAIHRVVYLEKTLWRMRATGFAADSTTDGWSGRVYVMRFEIDAPVADLTFVGAAKPEGGFDKSATGLTASGPGTSTGLPNATTRVT